MDAAQIALIAAGIVFVVGAVLVIVGAMTPPTLRAAAEDTGTGFWPIVKDVLGKMLKILFPPAGKPTPPAYQRRIAAGVLLMLLGAILAVGALTAAALTGGGEADPTPAPTPSSTASTAT